MKLLITGAKGQLGRELCTQLQLGGSGLGPLPKRLGHATVVAVDIEDADLTSLAQAMGLVQRHAPDVVINCAAYTNVDGAEENLDAAFAANALAPRNLAMACQAVGAKLVQLSTDYVFSGVGSVPYTEAERPAPQSVYGSTKLLGEEYVQRFCSRWFVVRTSWLYGVQGGNFVKTIARLAAERDELQVVNDQLGNPTNAEDLAHHLLRLAVTEEYGIYHCTGGGICSWYDFAVEIVRLSGGRARVKACSSAEYAQNAAKKTARRPAWSALEHTMLRATIGDEMRPWQQALQAYFKKMGDTQ